MLQSKLAPDQDSVPRRLKLRVSGVVQGVGFRPFVFGLAKRFDLSGYVLNDTRGVQIEVEGAAVEAFCASLRSEAPSLARIAAVDVEDLPLMADSGFVIAESIQGKSVTRIGPDAATCPECLKELRDPQSRFFGYAFINCTHCGPRYTITSKLPYDRAQTSMAGFAMCSACRADYESPQSRRFHAEPIACPACGPKLSHTVADICNAICSGQIVALKGIGGFHLICDARNSEAIAELRRRKGRDEKPFAVMVADLDGARRIADISELEEELLVSAARPIVLVTNRGELPGNLAPGLRLIGVMLAYAPVHNLIFDAISRVSPDLPVALVATSANPGGQPLVASNDDAHSRLLAIADMIVCHDRDILVRADDSVLQVISGAPAFIRRARGFVPEPIDLGSDGPSVIAFGADLKNTICVTRGREAFVSQHIGGLDNAETIRFQRETVAHLCGILDVKPSYAACDLHPDFRSTHLAEAINLPLVRVQHHLAHACAAMAEYRLEGRCLGIVLDGFGYGTGGGAWGGELLEVDGAQWRRAGHLSLLPLAGGDRAACEPWRMGVAALASAGRGDLLFDVFNGLSDAERLAAMMSRGMKSAMTSSMGRLFDAAAAISGLRLAQSYEGQAAMKFEAMAEDAHAMENGFVLENGILDFRPLLVQMAERRLTGSIAASVFHATLIDGLARWAVVESRKQDICQIVLSGGCMMNRRLAEGLCSRFSAAGLRTYLPKAMPANDGGLALGQAVFARHAIENDRTQVEET